VTNGNYEAEQNFNDENGNVSYLLQKLIILPVTEFWRLECVRGERREFLGSATRSGVTAYHRLLATVCLTMYRRSSNISRKLFGFQTNRLSVAIRPKRVSVFHGLSQQ